MILWHQPEYENVAPPAVARALLKRAVAADPGNAALRVKLAHLALDRYDFAATAGAFEDALRIDPELDGVRPQLAYCYNQLGRHSDAIDALSAIVLPEYERGRAKVGAGRESEAEEEFRAVLAADPHHRLACRSLGKLLRGQGRIAALLKLCDDLSERGAAHAQLFYTWGTALALAGRDSDALALLLDPAHVRDMPLPAPRGFTDIAAFNAALAEELLSNPCRLTEFPLEEQANRGSSRVEALFAGKRPDLIRGLLGAIQHAVTLHCEAWAGDSGPWARARPKAAHLTAWGLIQRGGDYEEWHFHRRGWLSGVYYVRVPDAVSAAGEGRGCIEFGPPTALARALPDYIPTVRRQPREGMLLLAPSHYAHRTIPTGADEYRISFAFDVIRDD